MLKIAEKKKKLKKDGKGDETIPEDNPDKYKHAIYVMVMKVLLKFKIVVISLG